MNERLEKIVEETRSGSNVDETVRAICEYISELEYNLKCLYLLMGVDAYGLLELPEGKDMSYCRFSSGDVYMYPTMTLGICCQACAAQEDNTVFFSSRLDAYEHLMEHREAGHTVPQYALDRLVREIAELGDEV